MEISIKWQQVYKELSLATDQTKRSLLSRPVWNVFPMADILERSRDHAVALFSRGIAVVVKQDNVIISNSLEMRNIYRKKGNTVYDLESIQPSDKPLELVGFI